MSLIKIIIGSTRDSRFSVQPATFIYELTKDQTEHTYELVDLKDIDLPFLDAATPPAMAGKQYSNDKVQAWSKIVDEADGFIVVTPEYDHSFPAVLKNAFDTIAPEWANKPVAFVSYGVDGGVRAVEALRPVVAWLGMHDLRDFLVLPNYWQFLDQDGTFQPTEKHIEDGKRVIKSIGFWADIFKDARTKLDA